MENIKIIKEAIEVLMKYENIANIIPFNDIEEKWIKKLNKVDKTLLLNSDAKLNLLKLGYGLSSNSNDLTRNYSVILYNLNKYLGIIKNKDYVIINNYAEKLSNIEGIHIFSTLSELALASYFSSEGYSVDFFHPFKLLYENNSSKNRDIDLEIFSNDHSILVEVYMPNYTPDYEGAFYGDSIEEIDDIKNQLLYKLNKKFDLKGHPKIIGIDKPLYLAVNIKYDSMLLSQMQPPLNFNKFADDYFNKVYNLFKKSLSSIIKENTFLTDILLFETDFFVEDDKVILFNKVKM